MIDIDKFKNINDTYGHSIGDEVIINLANTFIAHQRQSDIVCRHGGEEFVMLLPNTNIEGAKIMAEKLRVIVENNLIPIDDGKSIHYTISLGISQVDVQNNQSIENAINNADKALYEAKETGRNKVYIK